MFYVRNGVWIAECCLLSVLTLSMRCLAAARVQFDDKVASHFPSRRLLDTSDDVDRIKQSFYANNGEKLIFTLILFGVIFIFLSLFGLLIICRCCIRFACPDCLTGTCLEPLLRINLNGGTVTSPSSNNVSSSRMRSPPQRGRVISGPSLAPPRTNVSIILPIEGEVFPLHLHGIENPLYLPTNVHSEQNSNVVPIPDSTRPIPTPLGEILDMPPSYSAFVKEDHKYAKMSGNS